MANVNKLYLLVISLLLFSCESVEEEERIEVKTIGASEVNNNNAIVTGDINIVGNLPNDFNIVGRGIIFGKNSTGLEIKSCSRINDKMYYNPQYECMQQYFYTPTTSNVTVQSIEIYSEIKKDDGSLYGYVFSQIGNIGTFKCLLNGLETGNKYYARSFGCIYNKRRNTYSFIYGNIIEFNTSGLPLDPTVFIEIPALKLGVMKYDFGTSLLGTEADRVCSYVNSYDGVGGYFDWRLPTLSELKEIYKLRYQIGGFKNEKYWSSTKYGGESSIYYYFLDFSNNTSGHQSEAGTGQFSIDANIRLIRNINNY